MANTKISSLVSGSALAGTDLIPAVETAGVGPVTKTGTQLSYGALNLTPGFSYTTTGNTLTVNGVIIVGNSSLNMTVNNYSMSIGNSSVKTTVNSSVISVNTLTLSTSNVGSANYANGFSRMPNGLLMQWGWIAAVNSTANVTTFQTAFTNIFSVSATSNTTASHIAVTASNTTTITLAANSTTNTGVYWTAIGK